MFEKKYPYLASWIAVEGVVEMGSDYNSSSVLRLINEGGNVWEDKESTQIEDALKRAEKYLKEDFADEFGYELDLG